ncbi:M23 family metallopeptidase [Candidatus Pacearchaeota archaeon]|nr:M23 family metallopeptidase [Candidatus Pacearchaeota archaeon]
MNHLRTSTTLLLLNIIILISWSSNYESEKSTDQYNKLLDSNLKLSKQISDLKSDILNKDDQLQILKDNAAYLLALEPLKEYFTEEELFELIREIPKGNTFEVDFIVSAPFGKSMGFKGSYRKHHKAVDIAPINANWNMTPIGKGIIEDFGYSRVYGKFLYIRHSPQVRTFYAHADKIFYRATTGKEVLSDTVIMVMGESGLADGPHLHFSIEINTPIGWIAINPIPFLK